MPYALGPCEYLQTSLLSEDVHGELHRLQTVPGCQLSTTLSLVRQCQPYLLHVQLNFVFPNGTVGPKCQDEYDTLKAFVRSTPQAPTAVSVDSVTSSSLSASWTEPVDLGGCTALRYDVSVVDLYNLDVVFSTRLPASATEALFTNVRLRPASSYRLQIASVTDAGSSDPAMVSFSVPGSPYNDESLTPGALAGVVLGSFFGVIALIGLVLLYRRWNARRGYRFM
jgi:hypothetical protein